MTGCLALIGGGEWTSACTVNRQLLETAPNNTVAVLPSAAAFEGPDAMLADATRVLTALDASVVAVRAISKSHASDPAFVSNVARAGTIYFTSGSALHLRTMLKTTPLWEAVLSAWRNGAVLVGSGGGAMAFADPMIDPRGGAYTLGLGVVEGIAILTEADTWTLERKKRVLRMADATTVVAMLDTGAALLHTATGWQAHGHVELHQGGKPITTASLPRFA
jgi:cyanophycinase